jgi:hypothetical protein
MCSGDRVASAGRAPRAYRETMTSSQATRLSAATGTVSTGFGRISARVREGYDAW